MIARLEVYLPLDVYLPSELGDQFPPHEMDLGEMKAILHPPYACSVSTGDLVPPMDTYNVVAKLDEVIPRPTSEHSLLNGQAATLCNALRIDFVRDSFDRSKAAEEYDPSLGLALRYSA
jgi:hypothetical protein